MKINDVVINVYSGGTPNTRIDEYWNGGINWLSSGETGNDFIYRTDKTITKLGVEQSSTRLAHKGSIVIASAGQGYTRGQTSLLMVDTYINQSIICVEPDYAKVDAFYLYYFFKNSYELLRALSDGHSSRGSITTKMIRDLNISFPSLDYQRRAAKILYSLDCKITANNAENDKLFNIAELMFEKIYQHGTTRSLGSSLLDNIESGARPRGGAESEGVPSIGAEKIEKFGVYNYSSEKYISEDFFAKMKRGIIKNKDVLLYKDGAYTGKTSMCFNGFPHTKAAVNEHVFILNSDSNYAQFYLYFCLNKPENREMLHRIASSKAAQPGLNQSEVQSLEVKVADRSEIVRFEASVMPLMGRIATNALQNRALAQIRDALLPRLISGEINFRGVKK